MESKLKKKKRKMHYLDYKILLPYIFLVIVGLIMVYSSTSYLQFMPLTKGKGPFAFFVNQSLFLALSLFMMLVIYKLRTDFFTKKNFMIGSMIVIMVLLLVTRFTPLGKEINGAKGWIKLGPVSIQPAEYLKIFAIWYLAYILSRREKGMLARPLETVAGPAIALFGLNLLVAIQPDMGGAAIISLIILLVIMSSGIPYRWYEVILPALTGLALLGIEFISLFGEKIPFVRDYIYYRFAVFRDPFSNPDKGHQLINSYYALHNGGWFGRGLGNSIQKKGFLPEAHTDFIFAIVVEELGVIGAVVILAVLFFMIIRFFQIGRKAHNAFNSIMMYGIGILFLVQVFINLGGVLGIIPLTGVTFPFLSQGGNSLMVLSAAVAFALNISADEKRYLEQNPL